MTLGWAPATQANHVGRGYFKCPICGREVVMVVEHEAMHRSGELDAHGRRTNRTPEQAARLASRNNRPVLGAPARARAPQRTSTLVLQPAAGRAAQRNFERTVQNPWTVLALERLGGISRSTIEAFRRVHRDQPFGIWATTRGVTNLTTTKFERVARGDVVAFFERGGRVFYSGRVGATVHDLELGDRLTWERPPSKLPYEHIYTITHGRPVNVDARRELREWLPSNGVVLGFTVKEVPPSALRELRDLTAPVEVVVPAQPDDAPRDELEAAHQIQLRDVGTRTRSPLADNAFERAPDAKRQRELLERAGESHEALLKRLRDAFEAGGAVCKEDPSGVDLLVSWPGTTLIVEVKSTWGGFVRPVRNAVAQLYEYQFHLREQAKFNGRAVLMVALDRAPKPRSWLRRYLTIDRGIDLLTQLEDGRLRVDGPEAAEIVGRVPQFVSGSSVAGA
jgi:hypothetical protein